MTLEVEIPPELIPSTFFNCLPIIGIDSSIACEFNSETRVVKITNAFSSLLPPDQIKLSLSRLKNPSESLETSSFKVTSYTMDNNVIDFLDWSLTLNFVCAMPCKTCLPGSITECGSCYEEWATLSTTQHYLFE